VYKQYLKDYGGDCVSEFAGKTCPYCKSTFKEEDIVVECPKCGIPHHEECWKENGGCSTFGCTERHEAVSSQQQPNNACRSCGALMDEDQMFCPKCGTSKLQETVRSSICSKCGNLIRDDEVFCSKCGQKVGLEIEQDTISAINSYNQKVTNKKVKSKRLTIIIAAIVLIIGVGGYFGYQYYALQKKISGIEKLLDEKKYSDAAKECNAFLSKKQNADIKELLTAAQAGMKVEYMVDAYEFNGEIIAAGSNLEAIGNEVLNNWHSYVYDYYSIYDSVDNAISMALIMKSGEVSRAKDDKTKIDNLYSVLRIVPYEDPELNEIRNCIKEEYDAYIDFYQHIISPSGNYNSFSADFSSLDGDLVSKFNELKSLLN
jgi:RNA polymerase subunit RPABC4/transcription elongation factor Spt4